MKNEDVLRRIRELDETGSVPAGLDIERNI